MSDSDDGVQVTDLNAFLDASDDEPKPSAEQPDSDGQALLDVPPLASSSTRQSGINQPGLGSSQPVGVPRLNESSERPVRTPPKTPPPEPNPARKGAESTAQGAYMVRGPVNPAATPPLSPARSFVTVATENTSVISESKSEGISEARSSSQAEGVAKDPPKNRTGALDDEPGTPEAPTEAAPTPDWDMVGGEDGKAPPAVLRPDLKAEISRIRMRKGTGLLSQMRTIAYYEICITREGLSVIPRVWRRYKDFIVFRKELTRQHRNIKFPPLPSKSRKGRSNLPDMEFLEQRKRGLEAFLQFLVASDILKANATVLSFFKRDPASSMDWNKTVHGSLKRDRAASTTSIGSSASESTFLNAMSTANSASSTMRSSGASLEATPQGSPKNSDGKRTAADEKQGARGGRKQRPKLSIKDGPTSTEPKRPPRPIDPKNYAYIRRATETLLSEKRRRFYRYQTQINKSQAKEAQKAIREHSVVLKAAARRKRELEKRLKNKTAHEISEAERLEIDACLEEFDNLSATMADFQLEKYFPKHTNWLLRVVADEGLCIGCKDITIQEISGKFRADFRGRDSVAVNCDKKIERGTVMVLQVEDLLVRLEAYKFRLRGSSALAKLLGALTSPNLVDLTLTGSMMIPCEFKPGDEIAHQQGSFKTSLRKLEMKLKVKKSIRGAASIPDSVANWLLTTLIPRLLKKAISLIPFADILCPYLVNRSNGGCLSGSFCVKGDLKTNIWRAKLNEDSPAAEKARSLLGISPTHGSALAKLADKGFGKGGFAFRSANMEDMFRWYLGFESNGSVSEEASGALASWEQALNWILNVDIVEARGWFIKTLKKLSKFGRKPVSIDVAIYELDVQSDVVMGVRLVADILKQAARDHARELKKAASKKIKKKDRRALQKLAQRNEDEKKAVPVEKIIKRIDETVGLVNMIIAIVTSRLDLARVQVSVHITGGPKGAIAVQAENFAFECVLPNFTLHLPNIVLGIKRIPKFRLEGVKQQENGEFYLYISPGWDWEESLLQSDHAAVLLRDCEMQSKVAIVETPVKSPHQKPQEKESDSKTSAGAKTASGPSHADAKARQGSLGFQARKGLLEGYGTTTVRDTKRRRSVLALNLAEKWNMEHLTGDVSERRTRAIALHIMGMHGSMFPKIESGHLLGTVQIHFDRIRVSVLTKTLLYFLLSLAQPQVLEPDESNEDAVEALRSTLMAVVGILLPYVATDAHNLKIRMQTLEVKLTQHEASGDVSGPVDADDDFSQSNLKSGKAAAGKALTVRVRKLDKAAERDATPAQDGKERHAPSTPSEAGDAKVDPAEQASGGTPNGSTDSKDADSDPLIQVRLRVDLRGLLDDVFALLAMGNSVPVPDTAVGTTASVLKVSGSSGGCTHAESAVETTATFAATSRPADVKMAPSVSGAEAAIDDAKVAQTYSEGVPLTRTERASSAAVDL